MSVLVARSHAPTEASLSGDELVETVSEPGIRSGTAVSPGRFPSGRSNREADVAARALLVRLADLPRAALTGGGSGRG